jgi:hypothetical protein
MVPEDAATCALIEVLLPAQWLQKGRPGVPDAFCIRFQLVSGGLGADGVHDGDSRLAVIL